MQISIAPCSDLFLCSCSDGIPIVLLSYIFFVVMSLSILNLSLSFCAFLLLHRCSYLLLLLDLFFFTSFFVFLFIGTGLSLSLSIGVSPSSSLPLSIELSFALSVELLAALSVELSLEFLPSPGSVEFVPRLRFFLARFRT